MSGRRLGAWAGGVLLAGALVGGCGAAGLGAAGGVDGLGGGPSPDGVPGADGGAEGGSDAGPDAGPGAGGGGVDAGDVDAGAPWGGPTGCLADAPAAALGTTRLTVDPTTGRLRDALGRDVVLRGINVGGRSKWAPFLPFEVAPGASLDEVRAQADAFFAPLPGWGLDTVRLTLSWEALEPVQGALDSTYLDRYEALVDAAWGHGLRVIVDFHQDVFASPFCGDGFPVWTIPVADPGPPHHDCPKWFDGYLKGDDVKASFDALWDPASGIEDALAGMWGVVAARFADHPGVVGFEIVNEPGWGTAADIDGWKADVLTPFHSRLAARIHEEAPGALVLYDSTGVDAVVTDQRRVRPSGEGLVFAPHLYDFGLLSGGTPMGLPIPDEAVAAHAAWGAVNGTPILLGEFGVSGDPSDLARQWLDHTMDAIDATRISATLWEYSQGAELWNGEDLSVVDAAGAERPVLDVYVRPWVRALAGSGATFAWDREAGTAAASWTSDGGVTEIVIPARAFPAGPKGLTVEGEGACHAFDAARGELRVAAPAGVAVTVRFER